MCVCVCVCVVSCICAAQEMKELAALAYRDTTAENREFWKNEMGQALREIQQVYEDKLDTMRTEIEGSYSLKATFSSLRFMFTSAKEAFIVCVC